MEIINEKSPGRGIVISSIIIAVLFAIIVLYAGYVLSAVPESYFNNITSIYSHVSLNITGSEVKSLLSNALYGYGVIFLILGLISYPLVYMPLSHNLPEKAVGPSLAIGIVEIIVGIITIIFIIPGILMIVAWYQIRNYTREKALKAAIQNKPL